MAEQMLDMSKSGLQLEEKYKETMIVLMVVGPYKLHVFWEINPDDIFVIEDQLGHSTVNSKYVLRVYDVSNIIFDGNNAQYYFDIAIDKDAGNWYIDLWTSGGSYCVELGIKIDNGDFSPLTLSNQVSTPIAKPSKLDNPKWMKVDMEHNRVGLQNREYEKQEMMPRLPTCNDSIASNINKELNNYRPTPNQREMTITVAKNWLQCKDEFSLQRRQYFIKEINSILNDQEHKAVLSVPYATLKESSQNKGLSSITIMGA